MSVHRYSNRPPGRAGRFDRDACAIVISVLVGATRAVAVDPAVVSYGSSDASSVAGPSGLPGYKNIFWWDHTNLTVSVRAGESVDADKLQALHDAIEIWRKDSRSRVPRNDLADRRDRRGRSPARPTSFSATSRMPVGHSGAESPTAASRSAST